MFILNPRKKLLLHLRKKLGSAKQKEKKPKCPLQIKKPHEINRKNLEWL